MPIQPDALASLAGDYAKAMTSIRGRRVQRLLKREFGGADAVTVVQLDDGTRAVLGVSSSGAALCATDGRGKEAAVLKWLHGSDEGIEDRFDLLKDSLPLVGSGRAPIAESIRRMPAVRAHSAPLRPSHPQESNP